MVNNLVMDRYVEESSLKMNEKSKQHIRTLLTKFFGMKPDVAYNDLTRQDLIEMLSAFNATSIITFNSEKSKMNDFMKWMVEEGYGTDEPLKILGDITFFDLDRSHLYDRYYFRDYEELHNTMDEAFSERGSEFDTFRSAAVLVWFGIEIKYLSNMPESALETYINDDSLWNSLLTYPDVPNIKVEDIILPDTTIPPMDDEEEDDTIPSVPSTPIYPVPPTPIYPPSIDDNLPPVEGDDNESDGGETPDDGSVDDSENGDIPDTDGPDNDTTEEVTPPENQDTNGSEVEGGTLPDVSIDGTIKQQIREIVMSVLEEVL